MSNLVRQYYVTNDNTPKRVINKNSRFEERLKELEEIRKEKEEALKRRAQEESVPEEMEMPEFEDDGEFVQGIDALEVETPDAHREAEMEAATAEAAQAVEDILAQARAQADEILAEANEQARITMDEAAAKAEALFEENRKRGYEEGSNDKLEEIMKLKEEVQNQIDDERLKLEEEYKQKADEMEHDIVEAMIQVFDRVFHIQFDNKKELLIHLIKNTLMNVEVGKNFRIHVAQNNYKFLLAHLDDVRERVGNDADIEIVNDANLDSSDCQIETDYGIFDCGIDMELSNLVKDIRSLCS